MDSVDMVLKLKPLFASCLEQKGFVLVDLRFFKDHLGQPILEVLADRAEGGITLDECVDLNKELMAVTQGSGCLQQDYVLDVSSPGLDRPLAGFADFLRVKGREVKIFLKEAINGRMEYQGFVEFVDRDKIVVKTVKKKEIITIEIPLDKVNKAKQVIL